MPVIRYKQESKPEEKYGFKKLEKGSIRFKKTQVTEQETKKIQFVKKEELEEPKKISGKYISFGTETKVMIPEIEEETEPKKIISEEEQKQMIRQQLSMHPLLQQNQLSNPQLENIVNLVMQLGSNKLILQGGGIDERKTANLSKLEQIPLGYFKIRGERDGIRFWEDFVNWYLVTSQAIEGQRAKQIIQVAGAMAGGQQTTYGQKPSWFGRNVSDRKWKDRADQTGKQVIEKV